MNRRSLAFWVLLGVVVVAVGYRIGQRPGSGEPLDPDGHGDLGTRALVLFLEEYGIEVTRRAIPDQDTEVALLLVDQLDDDRRDELVAWVATGRTLVVADPGSPLAGGDGLPRFIDDTSLDSGRCDVAGLEELTIEAGSFLLYPTAGATASCFGDDAHDDLHVTEVGDGSIISLGSALPLTNEQLDEADNAVLAAELLVSPTGGDGTVAVLYEPLVGAGSGSVTDRISTAVRWAGWQLVVAFALFAWWSARRFGRPVNEPQPVDLPGSLLVRATGELLRRTGSHQHAAEVLRADVERRLRESARAPADTTTEALVEDVVARWGVDGELARRVLLGPAASTGSELVELVERIDRLLAAIEEPVGDGAAAATASADRTPDRPPTPAAPDQQPVGVSQ